MVSKEERNFLRREYFAGKISVDDIHWTDGNARPCMALLLATHRGFTDPLLPRGHFNTYSVDPLVRAALKDLIKLFAPYGDFLYLQRNEDLFTVAVLKVM